MGHLDSLEEVGNSWATPYVRSTCRIAENNGNGHVLGVDFGNVGATTAQFDDLINKVHDLHKAIISIGDAGSELVLLRRCADVCKTTHLLRTAGPYIVEASLKNFDAQLDRALSIIVGAPCGQNQFSKLHWE